MILRGLRDVFVNFVVSLSSPPNERDVLHAAGVEDEFLGAAVSAHREAKRADGAVQSDRVARREGFRPGARTLQRERGPAQCDLVERIELV